MIHWCRLRLQCSASDQCDEITLGQDADQPSVVNNWQAADLPFRQNARGIDQRGIRPDGDDLGGHHVFDRECVENLALSGLAVAKRMCESVAKEIALGHDADETLLVI